MADKAQTKGGWRWLVWVAGGVFALFLLLALVLLIASRPPVSNAVVKWIFESRGGGPAEVSGIYIGLGGARIASAKLGSDLGIEALRADYELPSILFGKINSVRARSIEIAASYGDAGLELPVVGTLGGKGPNRPSGELRLPNVAIDEVRASVRGLPMPLAFDGRLGLTEIEEGTYRLTFAGNSDLGSTLPTEIDAVFDGVGNAQLKLNSGSSESPTPGARPSRGEGVLVNRVMAQASLVEGKLRDATGQIDIRSGTLSDVSFGAARLDLASQKVGELRIEADARDIQFTPRTADALSEKMRDSFAPWQARAPFAAFASELQTLANLPHGLGTVRGRMRLVQGDAGPNPTWRAEVEDLEGTVRVGSSSPLKIGIVATSDGPARADLRLGEKPALGARFGLKVAGPGPDIEAGTVNLSSASGTKGSPLERIVALDIEMLKLDWPSPQVTIGLAAKGVHAMPTAQDALKLDAAVLVFDGAVIDGVSARNLRLDLSGIVAKTGTSWVMRPVNDCFALEFAQVTINALNLRRGGIKACASGSVPIVSLDENSAVTHINAWMEGGPILVDAGNASSRFDIAAVSGRAQGDFSSSSTLLHLADLSAHIVDATGSMRFAPLDISGAVQLDGNRLDGDILTSSLGERLLTARLDHDLSAESGALTLSTGDLRFRRGDIDLPRLLPALSGIVTSAAGTLRLDGSASWSPRRGLSSDGNLIFTGFGVTTTLGRIEGIDGNVALDRLWPARTPGPQVLNIETMDVGLPLADGTFTFNLPENFRLEIIRGVWPWAGGQLAVVDGAFVPGEKLQRLAMTADSVDLSEVFKLLSIDGLSGTGLVDGRLPIEVRDGDAFIVDGLLKAREGGVLKYTGEPAALAAAKGEGANLLFTALQNFNYQSLEIGVDGRVTGTVIVSLKLRGYNPDVYDGYPFEINIRIDSELANLITQTTQGLRIPGQIEKALPGAQ